MNTRDIDDAAGVGDLDGPHDTVLPSNTERLLAVRVTNMATLKVETVGSIIADRYNLRVQRAEAIQLLKSLHEWFMEKSPENYNGCGLWIDVDAFLKEHNHAHGDGEAG